MNQLTSHIPPILSSQVAVALCPNPFIPLPSRMKHLQEKPLLQPLGFQNLMYPLLKRERSRFSSASCDVDLTDVSDHTESKFSFRPCNSSDGLKCGLCERFLSQLSRWSLRHIVRSGDMPVAGVLSCCHVFHAECLEQTTPKPSKNDFPCSLCVRGDEEILVEQWTDSKLRNDIPRLRPFREDGASRPWGCAAVHKQETGLKGLSMHLHATLC